MEKIAYLYNNRGVITERILAENGWEVLVGDGERFDPDMLSRCGALMCGRGAVTDEVLDGAPKLRFICKQGAGVDRIDIGACTRHGVCVANAPGAHSISVAEHACALLMAAAKQIYPISIYLRREYPEYRCGDRYPAVELYGKTLAVIGFGNIGSYMAKLADGLDMKVIAYARHPERLNPPDYVELTSSLDEALTRADFVSLHVSGVKENAGLIGRRELSLMKKTAILVNTTRGFVIDEAALYDALKNGTIRAAGLDVFQDDPIKPGNPLLGLENLVATPHSAINTPESRARAYELCAKMIMDYERGRRPASALNDVPCQEAGVPAAH